MIMYEERLRTVEMLYAMSKLLNVSAQEINDLYLRCDSYAEHCDALENDYTMLEGKYNELCEEKRQLVKKFGKAIEVDDGE
jgi:flagellar biosynthesis chaperone FliJ